MASLSTTKRPAFVCFVFIVSGMCAAHFGIPGILVSGIFLVLLLSLSPETSGSRTAIVFLVVSGMAMELGAGLMTPPRNLPLPVSISICGTVRQPIRRNAGFTSVDLCLLDPRGSPTTFSVRAVIADTVSELSEGQRYQIQGQLRPLTYPRNPGTTDWDGVLLSRGCLARVFIDSCRHITDANAHIPPLRSRIRTHLNGILRNIIGESEGVLASAMLLGLREDVSREIMASFRNAGIVHVLAVSGLHVGIIVGVLFLAGTVLLPGFRFPAIFALAGLGIYVIIVGPYASVLRSSLMAAAILLGLTIGRRTDPLNSLSVAGLILLIAHPGWLWNPGFQLSFGATAGILFFTPRIFALLRTRNRMLTWIMAAVSASLGAQLGIFPMVMYHFRQWPLYGLIANIPAVLLMTVLIWSAILVITFSPVWSLAATLSGAGARWAARGLFVVAEGVSELPQSVISWGTPGAWLLLLIWSVSFVLLVAPKKSRIFSSIITVLIVVDMWMIWGIADPWSRPRDRIICLHIDGGNALVLESKNGDMLIIDPGSAESRKRAFNAVTDFFRFRHAAPRADFGVTSCSYTRSGTVSLFCRNGYVRRLYTPEFCDIDSICIPHRYGWEDIRQFQSFRIHPFSTDGNVMDGILIETPSGLRFLVAGEWGWLSDARLAEEASIGNVDILYTGPARDHCPSHLLLRRGRPKTVIAGGTESIEQGGRKRIVGMGARILETTDGAVIIEDSGSHATIRQIERS